MSSTTACLPSSLGWPTPLQVMIRSSMRPRKGRDTMLRMLMQVMLLKTCRIWHQLAFQRQSGTQGGRPSDASVQPGSFPRSLQWNKATDYLHFYTCPWVAFWEVNMMESQCPFLTSSCTHVRVTLPSFFLWHQFSVCLAYAMTSKRINKSQGESVKHAGINLKTPVLGWIIKLGGVQEYHFQPQGPRR